MIIHADGGKPGGRDKEARHMAEEYRDDAEVEQQAPPFELLLFYEFTGFCRPAELIVPVPEYMTDDKCRDGKIRENHP